jgi:hypothetical protein
MSNKKTAFRPIKYIFRPRIVEVYKLIKRNVQLYT